MTTDVEHFLKCLLPILDSSVESSFFRSVPHFLLDYCSFEFFEFFAYFGNQTSVWCWVSEDLFPFCRLSFCLVDFVLLMSSFLSSLYILEINPLSDWLVKIFSHSLGCSFVLLTMSFALQKLLSFRRSHLLIVFCVNAFKCTSPFSSMTFSIVGFMLRSLIYLDLYLCMVIDMDLFAFFYLLIFSYASKTTIS